MQHNDSRQSPLPSLPDGWRCCRRLGLSSSNALLIKRHDGGEKALSSSVSASIWTSVRAQRKIAGLQIAYGGLKNLSDEATHGSADILRGQQQVVSETNLFVNHAKLAV
jgi:hypothetical protein